MIIYLNIPFYLHQPTFGRNELCFFSFFFQNTVLSIPKRLNTKTITNCIKWAIATYKQCKQT